jgi:hypothetical protein
MFLFIPGLYILSTSGQMALNTSGQTGMIDQVCLDNQLNALPNSPPSKFYKKMSVATYSILGAFSLIVVILDWMGILDFEAHTLTTREKMCLTFISFIPVAMAWFHVVLLQNLREAMFIMTGGDWSSSTWGYGQVVALLTWIPAVMAFCLCLGE